MIIDFHLFLHSRLESERGLGRREPKKHEKLLPLAEYQHCPSVKYFPNDLSNSCNILMRQALFPHFTDSKTGQRISQKTPWQGSLGHKSTPSSFTLASFDSMGGSHLEVTAALLHVGTGYEKPDSYLPSTVAFTTELRCRWKLSQVQRKAQLRSAPSSKLWFNLELDQMTCSISQGKSGSELGNHLRTGLGLLTTHTCTHISPAMLGQKNIYIAVNELYICVFL